MLHEAIISVLMLTISAGLAPALVQETESVRSSWLVWLGHPLYIVPIDSFIIIHSDQFI